MRPLIGIPCHAGVGTVHMHERPIYYNNRSYVHAVERAGGVPILIPILHDLSALESLLSRLDGLLLSGGIDVDPRTYHETPHPLVGETNPQLDELELALAQWALKEDIPTLGICRGMQLLNVALGGDLYQDLSAQFPNSLKHPNWDQPRNKMVHRVFITPGSRMERVLGTREVAVNSLHHQAARNPGNGVTITGHADDGVAELLEVSGHRFMLAAQCHPEEIYTEEPAWSRLFAAFIEASSKRLIRHFESVGQALQVNASAI